MVTKTKRRALAPAPKRPPASTQDRRARFIAEYLADPKRNGTKAAIRAGFAEKGAHVTASRLLSDPKIRAEIDRRLARVEKKLADRYEITADRIKRELARLGFSNMLDYGVVRDDGTFDVDLSAVNEDQAAAIQSIKTKRSIRRYANEYELEEVQTELKLAPKREALVELGKTIGLFRDGPDVLVPVQFIIERTERSAGVDFTPPDGPDDEPA